MLKKFSKYAVTAWIRNNVVSENDAPVYCYGLELLLSSVINLLIMICISCIYGKPFILVPYILTFIPLGIYVGGYHAKSHVNCIVFNAALYMVAIGFLLVVSAHNATTICTFFNLISLLLIIFFSPAEAKNKPLSEGEAKKYRKISIFISVFIFIIGLILYQLCEINSRLYAMACYGELNTVLLMILGMYL